MNRQFDAFKNSDKTISIRVNNDKMLSFKIDPAVVPDLVRYHNVVPEQEVCELIINELDQFYTFTPPEREEYTETLKQILED